ncbi:MAG: exopolysaccharide biosynthesis protein [Rhodanobacteraceae bacterium]|nr:MAG: exopolysaccharide biosynthesis protein [Rhodanobacteraceae bacterium]
MNIVEKAAEKLKTLQPEQPLPPVDDAVPRRAPHTVERLQERIRMAEPQPAVEIAPPWHVDERALQRAGLLPREDGAGGRLADEVRRVKRPLLDNACGKSGKSFQHGQRIVVTSAVPGEGKTFTAMNLALSLAREPDFEVLLVDADIPKSDITQVLGLQGRAGLMEVLADERRRPADVIVRTDVPNLSIVPAGERHPLTAELFGGRRMQYVLEELGGHDRHRLLVFDSAPLLATPESPILATHMGQVLMVVGAGRTRQHEVVQALEGLGESQYVGLILNMSRLPAIENHYYSHYNHYSHYQFQDQ